MRFLSALRSTFVGAVALAALPSEAVSLPDGMTLPATYEARGTMTTTTTARFRGRTQTSSNVSRFTDTLTLGADGTLEWANLVGDGAPATGTWTEVEPNVLARSYDADVAMRVDAMLEGLLRRLRGFRQAVVTCTVIPRAVTVRRDGDRLTGTDRIDFRVRNARARLNGRLVFRWTGDRVE